MSDFTLNDILQRDDDAEEPAQEVLRREIEASDVTDVFETLADWLAYLQGQVLLSYVLDCSVDDVPERLLDLEEAWARARRRRYLESEEE